MSHCGAVLPPARARAAPPEEDRTVSPLKPLTNEQSLDEALGSGLSVIYKHSERCWICKKAEGQVREFASLHPEIPVYHLDVPEEKDLSEEVAGRLAVEHHTPQIIVIRDGKAAWSGSHFRISTRILKRETGLGN
jgi:bacillithiol system protein YtxJ